MTLFFVIQNKILDVLSLLQQLKIIKQLIWPQKPVQISRCLWCHRPKKTKIDVIIVYLLITVSTNWPTAEIWTVFLSLLVTDRLKISLSNCTVAHPSWAVCQTTASVRCTPWGFAIFSCFNERYKWLTCAINRYRISYKFSRNCDGKRSLWSRKWFQSTFSQNS